MMSPAVLLRLAWRRSSWVVVLPLAFAFVTPLALLEDHVANPFTAIWSGSPEPAVRAAVWQLAVLLPVAIGLVSALHRLELQHTMLGWMIPGARTGVAAGTATLAVPVAAVAALFVARGSPPAVAVAAFAVALFCFAVPGYSMDVTTPRVLRWVGVGLVALVSILPALLWRSATAQPLLITAAGLAGFAALLLAEQSAARARRRPLTWSIFSGRAALALYWARRSRVAPLWHESLATSRIAPWLRAGVYESESRFPRARVVQAVIGVAAAQAMNMPFMLILFAALPLSWSVTQLSGALLYPLARSRRADIAFAAALLDAVVLCGLMALLLPLARWLPPLALFADSRLEYPAGLAIALAFALAPIAQWSNVGRESGGARYRTGLWGHYVPVVAYLLSALSIELLMRRGGLATRVTEQVVIVTVLAVVARVAHWLALHRHFARADLARRGA